MKQYGYMIVEGQHDVEFVARLLRIYKVKPIIYKRDLEPFWDNIIPKTFPVNDDLLKRVPVPAFFQSDTHSIAIHAAQGITSLVDTLDVALSVLDSSKITSYGFILDADNTTETPTQRFENLIRELRDRQIDLPFPDTPGEVAGSDPSFGVFILPDNQNPGTLEDLLLHCAGVNYSNLVSASINYVDNINTHDLKKGDLEEFQKPAGNKKAKIACITSILKPGKSIQVSIRDNRWLDGESLDLPVIKVVSIFLAELYKLS